MAVGLQDLEAAAQRAGVGGERSPSVATLPPGVPPTESMVQGAQLLGPQAAPPQDPMAQLTQLLSGVASSPQGGPMMQAMTQLMTGAGGNGGDGQIPMKESFYGDGARTEDAANRGRIDPTNRPFNSMMNGGGADKPPDRNRYIEGETAAGTVDGEYPGMSPPGQAIMGGYLNAKKPMTTEEELADVSKRMGSGDPSADGNFPSQMEIDKIMKEPTDMNLMMFDKKYGKGAAAEILDDGKGGPTSDFPGDDEGDHEYR